MDSGIFGYVNVLKTAADASWAREEVLTNNIANVDTPNYRDRILNLGLTLILPLNRLEDQGQLLHRR